MATENKHPIEEMMKTVMDGLRTMVDVNTVVGDVVQAGEGTVIIPVSQVHFGFVAGGGEYSPAAKNDTLPFGGGSGAGVSVKPVGFLIVRQGEVRMLTMEGNQLAERLVDLAPQVLDKIKQFMEKKAETTTPAEQEQQSAT